MKTLCLLLLTVVVLASCAMADCTGIPYNCIGQIAPTMNITAHGTGQITGSFYGFSANFYDYVRVIDTTLDWTSGWVFENQTTSPGAHTTFGVANQGDNLVVEICAVPNWEPDHSCKNTDPIYASDPNLSDDGKNHAYVHQIFTNPFAFIGMEDLYAPYVDWDYNDLEFWLYNIDVTPAAGAVATPEPASMLLLGSGVLMALRQRKMGKK